MNLGTYRPSILDQKRQFAGQESALRGSKGQFEKRRRQLALSPVAAKKSGREPLRVLLAASSVAPRAKNEEPAFMDSISNPQSRALNYNDKSVEKQL